MKRPWWIWTRCIEGRYYNRYSDHGLGTTSTHTGWILLDVELINRGEKERETGGYVKEERPLSSHGACASLNLGHFEN